MSQRGQSTVETLLSLAGTALLAIAAVRAYNAALDSAWDRICFWIAFPSP